MHIGASDVCCGHQGVSYCQVRLYSDPEECRRSVISVTQVWDASSGPTHASPGPLLLVGYECVETGRHPASLAAPRICMQITCFNQPGPRDESWRHGLTLVRRQAGWCWYPDVIKECLSLLHIALGGNWYLDVWRQNASSHTQTRGHHPGWDGSKLEQINKHAVIGQDFLLESENN